MTRTSVAILTVSDRCSRGERVDTTGPALADLARRSLAAEIAAMACVPDEGKRITSELVRWALETPRPDLILTAGGTGLSPRDVTPEATAQVLERRHAGLMELVRLRCYEKTPSVFLSRGEAGTIGRSLVINLPGAERGATECFEALLDVLPHALEALRGEARHDDPPVAAKRKPRAAQSSD